MSFESSSPRFGSIRAAHIRIAGKPAITQHHLYVSPTGSDSNAGTSSAAPWASVAKVNATLYQPGDTILFQRGGEWHAQLEPSSDGTATSPITYGDYGSGVKPIFDGSDYVSNGAITSLGNSVYSFPVSASPNGQVYWAYLNHVALLAATGGGTSMPANSFYTDGGTVWINTNGVNPTTVPVSVGDRATGQNVDQGVIASNGHSHLVFNNLIGRETAQVPGGGIMAGGLTDAYVIRIMNSSDVTLNGCEADYGGKHNIGVIDSTGVIVSGLMANGGVNGVSGNELPYGNETALVAYADQNVHHTTQQWINCTVQNYPGSQPAFLTHNDGSDSIDSLLIQNLMDYGSPVALQPGTNVAITYKGGFIKNNSLVAYTSAGTTEMIDGVALTGDYPFIQVNGNATVQNCLVTNANQPAIQVNAGANNVIRFNTLAPYGYATAIDLRAGTSNSQIYGNIISNTSNAIGIANGSITYSADYDVFDSTAGSPTFGGQSLSSFQSAGHETHAVVANPLFVNTTAGDYSLQSTSPAINVVPTTVVSPALTTDIRGFTRPSANVYDAGAYEFQSVLHTPTIATAAAASPTTVTGSTTNLSVLGASVDGEATLFYTWSLTGTPPAAVTYSANGTNASKNTTATFSKAGTYNFLVTVSNGTYSTTSAVTVTVNQVSQGLQITPSQFFVPINTTQQFTAAVVDQFGNPISGASVTYSIQSGGGSINASGLFTAPGTTGTTIIKATSGATTATATANVVPPNQPPTVATAAACNPNPVTGTTAVLSVLGADDNGEANLTYTWSTVGTPPAAVSYSPNGSNAAKTTTATFTANGTYNFLVTIKDSNGLTTTSSVTVSVSTFVPIVLDGTKDGRYGTPLAAQNLATNYGNGALGSPIAPYSQLSAAYGVIDQPDGQFDLFIAGSLNLVNAHLELLIDSVPGQGAANLNQLNGVGTWGTSPISQITLDSGFRPDHIFTFAFGGGTSLDYFNFDNGTYANNNLSDPANTTVTSYGSVPYFQERVNNAAASSIVAANTGGSLTTGAEFAFSLSALGYTSANYTAGTPIGVQAIISYGSHYQTTNQSLAPYNATATETSSNGGGYFSNTFDLSNAALFPGNQFVSVPVPAGPGGPTVATPAAANPNPVTGSSAALSVLGADSAGESTLTYTWSTTGTPPAGVSFSANGTNAAKNTTATFTANGTYNFLVTIQDGSGLTTTSTVTATVTGAGTGNAAPTVATAAAASPSTVTGTTTALSVLGADDGGEASLTYTWATTGTPPAAVTFSANGTNAAKSSTATFTKAGSYTFQVTIKDAGNLTTTSNVTVTVNQTVTTVTVTPATVSVATNATQQFTAAVKDQFGTAISSPTVTWSIVTGGGSVNASGLYTAPATAGSASVKATSGSANGTAAVTITASNAAPTVATPAGASPSTVTGTTTALSVLGADDGGEANLVYTWATTGTPPAAVTFSANGTNASKSTTATFTKAGSYTFQVTIKDAGNLTTTSSVTVTVSQTATTVTLSPTSASVVSLHTQQFAATVNDQFGTAIASPSVTWSIVTGGGTVSASGLYTAPAAAGSASVKATSGSASGTAAVTITNSAPSVATAAAASPSTVTGTTTALSVLGADDGGEANLVYTWATTGTPPAAVTFSANGTNAAKSSTATFTKAGSYTFQVTIKDGANSTVTSSVTVTVNQTATTVTLSPTSASVAANATQQFTATVKDQFATAITSPSVTWSVLTGSGTISASGLYTAPATAGSATVKAVSGPASATAAVTITISNAAPTVATAAHATPSPVTGTTTVLAALGADDGGEANLTYTWATTGTPPAAVTFSANGTNAAKSSTATFTKAGSYTFQVTIKDAGNLTVTSNVTVVVNQTVATIAVSPATATLFTNATQQYTASVSDQFAAAITGASVTWTVFSGTGTISASGLYTAPAAAGSATVKATSGAVSGTASITVTTSGTTPITVDGSLDSRYGSAVFIQNLATNFGNGNYTGPYGSGATAPYSQLSAVYGIIDFANNQFDLFIAGSLSLSNAHLDMFIDSVPSAGVTSLASLATVSPYNNSFSTIKFDYGFQPDHIFTFAYGGGTSADYVNLDTGGASHVAYTQSDPASGLITENVGGVPAYSERVNNAQQNTIIAANSGGSITTGMEWSFNLSALGYTAANFAAGVPINVGAIISYGSHTIGTNQIIGGYTPAQSELNNDGGIYTFFGTGNFDFSNSTRFGGNQFTTINTSAVAIDGVLDGRYGTADVIQTQATNFGNANYTGPYGNGATAPYSQLSAGYTVIDYAHNQLDLFIAGSLNLSNAHLDLFIDSVPTAGVTSLASLATVSPYNNSFSTIKFDTAFQPDHIYSFAYSGGTSVDYTNLDTGGSSHVAYTEPDPASGVITENVAGVPVIRWP